MIEAVLRTVHEAEQLIERLRLYPVRLDYVVVNLATGTERTAICDRTRERSARMGTALAPTAFGLEFMLPP